MTCGEDGPAPFSLNDEAMNDNNNSHGRSGRRPGFSLGQKLFAFLLLNLLAVLTFVGGMAYQRGRDVIQKTMQEGVEHRMDALARILAYPVFVEDQREIQRILEDQLRDPEIVYVITRRGDGKILSYQAKAEWQEEAGLATFRPLAAGLERSLRAYVSDQGTPFIESIVSLRLESDPGLDSEWSRGQSPSAGKAGWVQIGFTTEWTNKQWTDFRRNLLLASGGLAVLFAFYALIFVGTVVKPIRSLVRATRKVGEGSFDCRVDIRSRDEVGELAASFNQMTARLQAAYEKIREHQKELEAKVEERTAELQRAKENLEKAYLDLKELDRMKDSFLSSVSHELRTPLTSIRSFSEILLQYEDTDPKTQREFIGIINTESERLTRLINDVLDLSRIEARRMVWHDDLMSVREIVEDVARVHQGLLAEKNLTLSLEIAPDLPYVFADKDRIQQVLTNLLGNAIKFSSSGGRIAIRAESFMSKRFGENTPWVKVCVSDQGVGIDPKDHEFIFDKFSQIAGDTLSDRPKGTGLGLPICREIVSHYGGNIWVESEKGKGANFYFTLPGTQLAAKGAVATQARCPSLDREGEAKTILVVDDNENMRRLLKFQLESRGYRVVEAAGGEEAIERARSTQLDLITLDLMMPAMSGYDLLGMLREDPLTRTVPILIVSVVEDEETGILLGANDYLRKPFFESELMGKVRRLLTGEKRSVLIVDDDQSVRETLRMQLRDLGYEVWTAEDGQVAIESLMSRRPDLVILDVIMPRKNGHEVLEWIRQNPATQDLPVIVLTAQNLTGNRVSMLTLGVDAYLQKSQGMEPLFQSVARILSQPLN